MRRTQWVVASLAGLVLFAPAPAADKAVPKSPPQLDAATTQAWKRRGFEPGWIGSSEDGYMLFTTDPSEVRDPLPAFDYRPGPGANLEDLPSVSAPFGLRLLGSGLPGSPQVTDADLGRIKNLKNLTAVCLRFAHVTAAGLKELAECKDLTRLDLFGTEVTDAGLREVANMTGLTQLQLTSAGITDAGWGQLKGLKNLSALNLQETMITDAGLRHLGGLDRLTVLRLHSTKVTDEGLTALAKARLDQPRPLPNGGHGRGVEGT